MRSQVLIRTADSTGPAPDGARGQGRPDLDVAAGLGELHPVGHRGERRRGRPGLGVRCARLDGDGRARGPRCPGSRCSPVRSAWPPSCTTDQAPCGAVISPSTDPVMSLWLYGPAPAPRPTVRSTAPAGNPPSLMGPAFGSIRWALLGADVGHPDLVVAVDRDTGRADAVGQRHAADVGAIGAEVAGGRGAAERVCATHTLPSRSTATPWAFVLPWANAPGTVPSAASLATRLPEKLVCQISPVTGSTSSP
jgi:hypothetical protein